MPAPVMTQQEVASMYSSEFSDMKSRVRERQAFLPRINLTVPRTEYKDKKGVKVGEWYLTPGDTPQGETPKYENLGTEFECVVLSDSMQLAMRDDDTKKTMIESTEFQNFAGDPIFLLDGRQGPMHIAAVAPYSGKGTHTIAKIRKDPRYPTKATKDGSGVVSAIGLNFNVYVLLTDGRLAVLGNTKRGHFGTDPETGLTCEFTALAPDSFLRCRATCHEQTPGLTLAHRWRVTSVASGGGSDEPRPAFEITGLQPATRVQEIRSAAQRLQVYQQQRWADKLGYAWNNTSPAQRAQLVSAYSDVRQILDMLGGNEDAAMMVLGKKPAPALIAEPDPELAAMEQRNAEDTKKKIDDIANGEIVDEPPLQAETQGVADLGYASDIKAEDLPF